MNVGQFITNQISIDRCLLIEIWDNKDRFGVSSGIASLSDWWKGCRPLLEREGYFAFAMSSYCPDCGFLSGYIQLLMADESMPSEVRCRFCDRYLTYNQELFDYTRIFT